MMTQNKLPIITAEERAKEVKPIKGCILGKSGIGKTSLLYTLNPEITLFVDLEAGDLAVKDWKGDQLRPRTWEDCRDLVCFMRGVDPKMRPDQPHYNQRHFNDTCQKLGDPAETLGKYKTIFLDSITAAGRLCFNWCKGHPANRNDLRGAYGMHAIEMLDWLTQLQHIPTKNVWMMGILDDKVVDGKGRVFSPQIEGSKVPNELNGIVDQVSVMCDIPGEGGKLERVFINHTLNDYGYPAKDRSGKLAPIEPAHLGQLMKKILSTPETPKELTYFQPTNK